MSMNDDKKYIIDQSCLDIYGIKICFYVYFFYRIADLSDEVGRLRPPRLFYSDKIIRPYNRVEAFGNAILQVEKENS